jgi:crotonobetainyl-CoA:carnitine CoA-transferase CaiB-like acyl-CoA transferase
MQGVRILEVAEHTFVPAASAILADWGAEVIKIEHVERGDAMRGLAKSGLAMLNSNVHVILEHSNRGKKSLGLDLASPEGLDILYKLAGTCDVFLTNKVQSVRTKLKIDEADIKAVAPNIIYTRGTGQGERGPDADKGSYDMLGFWCRAGIATSVTQPDADNIVGPPGPAFGDSIGAMTIAGGIMGALYHREKTGEATSVDVSLLSTGMWAQAAAIAISMQFDMAWQPMGGGGGTGNPLVNTYRTRDDRFVSLSCLQAARYWGDMCRVIERPELATDERFHDHDSLMANAGAATDILREIFAAHTVEEWRAKLEDFTGQWAVVQTTLEVVDDPQTVANDYVMETATADGTAYRTVTTPVQFGGEAHPPKRAPEFNEHGDQILADLGLDWDTVVDLKVRGIVA